MTAEEIVQKQLDYYNNHDIDGFASTYSEDIKLFNKGEAEPFVNGKEALKERYKQRFSLPNLHAEVVNRMILGNTVIDYEHVTGVIEGRVIKAIAIYEVKDGLINNVWFIRD